MIHKDALLLYKDSLKIQPYFKNYLKLKAIILAPYYFGPFLGTKQKIEAINSKSWTVHENIVSQYPLNCESGIYYISISVNISKDTAFQHLMSVCLYSIIGCFDLKFWHTRIILLILNFNGLIINNHNIFVINRLWL